MPSSFSALIALTKIVTSKFEILVENKFWHDHNFWSQFKKPPYLMLHYILTSFKPGCQSSQILRPDRCEALQTRGSTPEVVKIVKPIVKREWPQNKVESQIGHPSEICETFYNTWDPVLWGVTRPPCWVSPESSAPAQPSDCLRSSPLSRQDKCTQNSVWLILRCWGKSSILCQQNSDAL